MALAALAVAKYGDRGARRDRSKDYKMCDRDEGKIQKIWIFPAGDKTKMGDSGAVTYFLSRHCLEIFCTEKNNFSLVPKFGGRDARPSKNLGKRSL